VLVLQGLQVKCPEKTMQWPFESCWRGHDSKLERRLQGSLPSFWVLNLQIEGVSQSYLLEKKSLQGLIETLASSALSDCF